VSAKKDPIKSAGPDKIRKASIKAEKEMRDLDDNIAMSVCGALCVHPLSMARKLAIGRFVDAFPDADEQEVAMVSTYVLSLPKEDFWIKARNPKNLLSKAAAFADECDSDEYERLMKDTVLKISHLQETEAMQGGGDDNGQSGNAVRSPE
jgi:hypothetical protein